MSLTGYDAWKTAAPETGRECPECGECTLQEDSAEREEWCEAEGCDYSAGHDWDRDRDI